jgi:hypothetical protein
MVFRFAGDDAVALGGWATSLDGIEFARGTEHWATIEFWAEEYAEAIVREGARFTLWYGGDIGEGIVTAVR